MPSQILPEPERKEFDLEGIFRELEKDGSKVARSALEKSQMASKGVTASHFQKCGRLETSFVDGLRSVGKFFTLPMPILVSNNNILTNLRYPSSLFIENADGSQTCANLLTPVETVVGRERRTVPVE